VYVWVNVNPDADPNTVHSQGEVDPYRELIEDLRDRVRSLEKANRENWRIIAALTSHIPEIETPATTRAARSPEDAREGASEGRESRPRDGEEAQNTSERPRDTAEFPVRGSGSRPWWRRVFGG
jgi:hypothetical protein